MIAIACTEPEAGYWPIKVTYCPGIPNSETDTTGTTHYEAPVWVRLHPASSSSPSHRHLQPRRDR